MSAVAQTSVFIQPVGFMTSQWRTETGLQLTVYKQYGDRSSNWYFKVLDMTYGGLTGITAKTARKAGWAINVLRKDVNGVTLFRDDYCPKHARLAVQ